MSFEEQMMPKEKYANIFLCKIEAIVFINLQIFHNTCEKMFINSLLFVHEIFYFQFSLQIIYGQTNISFLQ